MVKEGFLLKSQALFDVVFLYYLKFLYLKTERGRSWIMTASFC